MLPLCISAFKNVGNILHHGMNPFYLLQSCKSKPIRSWLIFMTVKFSPVVFDNSLWTVVTRKLNGFKGEIASLDPSCWERQSYLYHILDYSVFLSFLSLFYDLCCFWLVFRDWVAASLRCDTRLQKFSRIARSFIRFERSPPVMQCSYVKVFYACCERQLRLRFFLCCLNCFSSYLSEAIVHENIIYSSLFK